MHAAQSARTEPERPPWKSMPMIAFIARRPIARSAHSCNGERTGGVVGWKAGPTDKGGPEAVGSGSLGRNAEDAVA